MKTKKYYLGIAIVIGILCTAALSETEPSQADESFPFLIDSTVVYSPLSGIEEVSAIVFFLDDNVVNEKQLQGKELRKELEQSFEEKGLVRKDFEDKVKRKLEESGIKVGEISYETPNFVVVVHIIKPSDSQQYVFTAYSSLIRLVSFQHKGVAFRFSTDVWQSDRSLQVTSIEDLPNKITQVVMQQVEVFVAEYLLANPPDKQPSDANIISKATKEQIKPAAKSTTVEYMYVASKNSKVFHKPDCSSAKRIKPENLIGYSSRDEAINAGKRPCKRCKP